MFFNKSELESGPSEFDKYQKNPNLNFGQSLLMELFDTGKRKLFFENWNRLIPFHLRSRDSLCTVMEFYLHVYFCIYLLFPNNSKVISIES